MLSHRLDVVLSLSPDFVIVPPALLVDHPRGLCKDQINCYLLIKSFEGHSIHLMKNGITYDINGVESSPRHIDVMVHIGDVFQNNRRTSDTEFIFEPHIPITWVKQLEIGPNNVMGAVINVKYENLAFDRFIPNVVRSNDYDVAYGINSSLTSSIELHPRKYMIVISNDLYRLTSHSPEIMLSHNEFYNQSHSYRSNKEFQANFSSCYNPRIIYVPKVSLRYFLYLNKCANKRYYPSNNADSRFYEYCESICLN